MIPRVRPSFHLNDLKAALLARKSDVTDFENALASYFGIKHALVFPYGRSAIYALLQGMGLQGEVVQPAYNCVVVAHATVLGGCQPVFVDAQRRNPNQDIDEMVSRVSSSTSAVIPTSIFGIPFDGIRVQEAIRRRNPSALIIMDCSQAFSAGQGDVPLVTQGDASILAFGIGKPMTSLYGGALLSNNDVIYNSVRDYRDSKFKHASRISELARWFYFMASWAALTGPFVGLTDWLEHSRTPLYSYLQKLRSREAIRLPADNLIYMKPMEAAIGRQQLKRASSFIDRRRKIAAIYEKELAGISGLEMLEWGYGSSYAIYSIRLSEPEKRSQFLESMRKEGVQGDTVLSYVVPDLDCYSSLGYKGTDFPNSLAWSQTVVNLPNHPTMSDEQIERTVNAVKRGIREIYA